MILGTLDLTFSETFKVVTDRVTMEMIPGRWIGGGNEEVCCLRVLFDVEYMEAIGGGREFKEPLRSVYFEDAIAIPAVVGDAMFLTKEVKGEDTGDSNFVHVDFVRAKICNLMCVHCAAVAMHLDRSGGGVDISNMLGIGNKVDFALAVQEKVFGVDGAFINAFGEDNDTRCIAGNGGIVDIGSDGMELLGGWLDFRANGEGVPELVALATANICMGAFVDGLGECGYLGRGRGAIEGCGR